MNSVNKTGTDKLGSSFSFLNWTQFQTALNDNIFKLLLIFFLIRNIGSDKSAMLTGLAGIIFALPFILFVPAAGVLADRYSKSRITVLAKIAEIIVMVTGALMFWFGNPWLGFAVLFMMSTQSAFFGPTKYGIIPELVKPHQLSRANGYLVSLMYMSVILGTVFAPWLTDHIVGPDPTDSHGGRFALAALACVVIAVTGTLTSFGIQKTPAMGSDSKISILFWKDVIRTFREIKSDRFLILAIFGAAYFSLVGAFIQLNLIPYSIEHLGITDTQGGYLFLFAAIGIGVGSLVAGKLSGRNIEFGIIPIGAVLIAFSSMLLFLLPYSVANTRVLMFGAGLGAGLFIIPLDAFIQFRSPRAKLGEVLAAHGFLSWMGILGAGLLIFSLGSMPFWKPAYTFALLGVMTLIMTVFCLKLLPDFFARFMAMALTRSIYKIKTFGTDNLPIEGGALLVCNHVAYTDALVVSASQQRRIRFLMAREIFDGHPMKWLFKLMRVIPISSGDNPRELIRSIKIAREQMAQGYMVCIFAEGALTRNGQMQSFKAGLEKIANGTNCPIIPMYLGGVWGSRFSHYRTLIRKDRAPLRWRYPVSLYFGEPMKSDAKAWQVQQAVRELSTTYFEDRCNPNRSVAREFIRTARKYWRQNAMTDTTGKSLTYGKSLIAALLLAEKIKKITRSQSKDNIGIALPPSVGGALVNLSVLLAGKVAVNLNFTASDEAFGSAIEQAELKTVITSKKLIEKVKQISWPDDVVYLEDVLKDIRGAEKIAALLKARLCPVRWLAPRMKENGHDLLTIMFSSGTTGDPKGVVLSHQNILSNVESIRDTLRPDVETHLCATLPLFHSFGYTAGIYFPLLGGFQVSYHTSPLDTGQVVTLIKKQQCNTLFTTPSFLQSYYKKAEADDLRSLKMIVGGAEKLKQPLADAFEKKFGVRPLEGYGTTEMSPVVAFNLSDLEHEPERQVCNKPGSIGQPLPGVAVKITDLETRQDLPPGESGMMLVKGPNRMREYLKRPDLTEQALSGEWYITGDIAHLDEDGFIFITDRLHRFSKIAGEMVPHIAVEEIIIDALDLVDHAVAVTAVPDDRKGERLVLLYTKEAGSVDHIQNMINVSGLPNLWRPAANMYFEVESMPLTSTGKLDIRMLRNTAIKIIEES